MLKKFKEGSDLTLINNFYIYPKKNEDGKWDNGSMTLVYKDNTTGQKYQECIEDPDYEFYYNENGKLDYNHLFFPEQELSKFCVPFKNLELEIAKITNQTKEYYDNISNGNRRANKRIHLDTNLFQSDLNIEDHYRCRFDKLYTNNTIPVTKSYLDIEADTINMAGDFPELGECPINAVSYINDIDKKIYVFLLRNNENPLIQEFENEVASNLDEVKKELRELIRDTVGGWKQEIRYGLHEFDYKFMFYDEEIELLRQLFIVINHFKSDFVLAWNMAFDIPYIIERIKKLGYDPANIICHPDFKHLICKYTIDELHDSIAERGDLATISSYSVYLDQMIHFGSRRKGQKAFQKFKLDYIGKVICKVRKLDYSHITTRIAEFPWKAYKLFVFYNIIDTIVQKCIEIKTGDIDYVFSKALINNTRYNKTHRQTTYLTNRIVKEFNKDGFIVGNNANKYNPKPETKYPGAFVADPIKLNDYSKIKIGGIPVNLLDNLDDYDYKSLYPSEMQEFNMSHNTMIGQIVIENQIRKNENPYNNEYFIRGGYFIEDLHSRHYIEFCNRWLKMANYNQMYNDVIEYFTLVTNPMNNLRNFTMDGNLIIIQKLNKDKNRKIMAKVNPNEKIRVMDKTFERLEYNDLANQININEVVYHG